MRVPPRTRSSCAPVDVCALALGYFQMIVSSVGVLVVISYFVINFQELVAYRTHSRQEDEQIEKLVPLSLELLRLILCLIMAIVLVIGVNKRRPGYVLAYLIFGVVKITLALIYTVFEFCNPYGGVKKAPVGVFILFSIYSLCLAMVYSVYRNIILEKDNNDIINNALLKNCADDIKKKDVV